METSYQQPRARKSHKWLWIGLITGVVVLIAGAGSYYYFVMRSSSPIPKNISQQAVYPLYYPKKMPQGYIIDKKSFKYEQRQVSYTLTASKQPKILVTIQPKPATLDLDEFTNNLPGKIGVLTPYGTAAVGISGPSKIGSLVSGDVWIFITTTNKVSDQNMKTIVSSLQQTIN